MKAFLESILHESVDFEAEALDDALENGGIQITWGELIVMVFKRGNGQHHPEPRIGPALAKR